MSSLDDIGGVSSSWRVIDSLHWLADIWRHMRTVVELESVD